MGSEEVNREEHPGYTTRIIVGRFHFSHTSAWKNAEKFLLFCISILYILLESRMFY